MQLKAKGKIATAVGLMSAALISNIAHAQNATPPDYGPNIPSTTTDSEPLLYGDEPVDELGSLKIDSSVLFYKEAGGRVKAIEPVASATWTMDDGKVISLELIADTLTGATPNGATPWFATQTFNTPSNSAPGHVDDDDHDEGDVAKPTQVTTTQASGSTTTIIIGGTPTAIRQFTVNPHTLPLDAFEDERYAGNLALTLPLSSSNKLSLSGGYSKEQDYAATTFSAGISHDFNQKNTTLSAAINYEADNSNPFFGTPVPLSQMTGVKGGGERTKTVAGFNLGLTQVMTRNWLFQLNYSYGKTDGYQNDPYRIITRINPANNTLAYLYESRPETRIRQSIFAGSKIAIGSNVTDVSARVYQDDWGIKSLTAELSEYIPLSTSFYIEPHLRYYSQTKANFFNYYLLSTNPLPKFASSDSRLGEFNATTLGATLGFKLMEDTEVYLRAEAYKQKGDEHPTGILPVLSNENMFSGVNAGSLIVGFTYKFK